MWLAASGLLTAENLGYVKVSVLEENATNLAATTLPSGSTLANSLSNPARDSKLNTSATFGATGYVSPAVVFSGTSGTAVVGQIAIFNTNDTGARTLTIPSGAACGLGYELLITDSSGSVTAGHTLTVSPSSGTIHGAANNVITPGTNKAMSLVSDGTNWFITGKQ